MAILFAYLLIFMLFTVCPIVVALKMAEDRHRERGLAFIGGLLFSWLAPIYYLAAGNKKHYND